MQRDIARESPNQTLRDSEAQRMGETAKISSPRTQKGTVNQGKELIDEVYQKLQNLERVVRYLEDMKLDKDKEIDYLEAESKRLGEEHVRELLTSAIHHDLQEEALQFQLQSLKLETHQLAEELGNWQRAVDMNQMMRDAIIQLQKKNMDMMKAQSDGIGDMQQDHVEYQAKLTKVFRLILANTQERIREDAIKTMDVETRQALKDRSRLRQHVDARQAKVQSFWERYQSLEDETRLMRKEREDAVKSLEQQMQDMARAKKSAAIRSNQAKPLMRDPRQVETLSTDVNVRTLVDG
eukprot:TRINITY_DN982_c0_g3_i7.p1 TRINITY_DN982_c0_g3~~TRINITY_DN982_c0_g3_i7.p1  ORF type:complete len:295 (-),score=79.35 TRINITY_DN982_c0_g3_i7:132-1016(-)